MSQALKSAERCQCECSKAQWYNFDVFDALLVLFVGLKLTNLLEWSWVWVLFPMWISFLVAVVHKLVVKKGWIW